MNVFTVELCESLACNQHQTHMVQKEETAGFPGPLEKVMLAPEGPQNGDPVSQDADGQRSAVIRWEALLTSNGQGTQRMKGHPGKITDSFSPCRPLNAKNKPLGTMGNFHFAAAMLSSKCHHLPYPWSFFMCQPSKRY